MARIPFTKLKCKINTDEIPVQIGEETIAVKQYLPIQEKLELIGKVVMQAHEQDENYSNPVKAGVYRDLEVIFAYTNISFTDKQKEDLPKLYDMLYSSGIISEVIKNIPEVIKLNLSNIFIFVLSKLPGNNKNIPVTISGNNKPTITHFFSTFNFGI